MALTINDCAALANGVKMPWLGFGTFQIPNTKIVIDSVKWAIEAGYRHIDTASIYGNETGVGIGIAESGLSRDKLFITTKVWNADQGYGSTLSAYENSLRNLKLDYVDLYLIHWPVQGKYKDTWKAIEQIYKDKRVRAIGVSNFHIHHLNDLMNACEIPPMVNQVECHPMLPQNELRSFCQSGNIQFQAWSPLMKGRLSNTVLDGIAQQYGKTPAQVVLRWDLQNGIVTIPKSVHQKRIIENTDIFDFELSSDDVDRINGLKNGTRLGPDPDNFNF